MNTIIVAVVTGSRTACHVVSSSAHDCFFILYFTIQTFSLCCNPTGFIPVVRTDSNPDPLTDKIFYFYSVKVKSELIYRVARGGGMCQTSVECSLS